MREKKSASEIKTPVSHLKKKEKEKPVSQIETLVGFYTVTHSTK